MDELIGQSVREGDLLMEPIAPFDDADVLRQRLVRHMLAGDVVALRRDTATFRAHAVAGLAIVEARRTRLVRRLVESEQ